jgi:hypothetical protein
VPSSALACDAQTEEVELFLGFDTVRDGYWVLGGTIQVQPEAGFANVVLERRRIDRRGGLLERRPVEKAVIQSLNAADQIPTLDALVAMSRPPKLTGGRPLSAVGVSAEYAFTIPDLDESECPPLQWAVLLRRDAPYRRVFSLQKHSRFSHDNDVRVVLSPDSTYAVAELRANVSESFHRHGASFVRPVPLEKSCLDGRRSNGCVQPFLAPPDTSPPACASVKQTCDVKFGKYACADGYCVGGRGKSRCAQCRNDHDCGRFGWAGETRCGETWEGRVCTECLLDRDCEASSSSLKEGLRDRGQPEACDPILRRCGACARDDECLPGLVCGHGSAGRRFCGKPWGVLHMCADAGEGSPQCWGRNDKGQASPPSVQLTQLTFGDRHTCGVAADGDIHCWGDDSDGQSTAPPGRFRQVSAGASHTCALGLDGHVVCWGAAYNTRSQGALATGPLRAPQEKLSYLAAGGSISCAINEKGRLNCWSGVDPTRAKYYSDYFAHESLVSVAVSNSGACGIDKSGGASCAGEQFIQAPEEPPQGVGGFSAVVVGAEHACALTSRGHVLCWGKNPYGQASAPDGTFTSLMAGAFHTCGTQEDGRVLCWGAGAAESRRYPDYGQSLPPTSLGR